MRKLTIAGIIIVIITQIIFLVLRFTHVYIFKPIWLFSPLWIGAGIGTAAMVFFVLYVENKENRENKQNTDA